MAKQVKAVETIDMTKYNNSDEICDECVGCDRVFDHILPQPDDMLDIITQKCLAYAKPASKWPGTEKYATHLVTVKGSGNNIITKQMSIAPKFCALASHYIPDEVIKESAKQRAGQQKQKKG